ncbi:MAG: NAD(P)/FAD-dependent oxidoreductase, partial [Pseudomonadota bacterium]
MSIEEFGDIHDVVVIGAGAAGVGVALALRHAGIERYVVLERDRIGASFANWPAETRFITPSFPTNSVGMLDLNSIAIGVSPGWSMEVEHPSGQHYAEHLRAVAEHFELPVIEGVAVNNVIQTGKHFLIETSETALRTKHVIWATGEFQFPQAGSFPGSELCRHTATVDSYETLDADDLVFIIGGFESGIDAAYHLACNNKESWVFDAGAPWENNASDPSVAVSPFTMERMREAVFGEHVTLNPNAPVVSVTRHDGDYIVTTKNGASYRTSTQPLYAGGFNGCHGLIREMFE